MIKQTETDKIVTIIVLVGVLIAFAILLNYKALNSVYLSNDKVVTIDYSHEQIHKGNFFFLSNYSDLGIGDEVVFGIMPPNASSNKLVDFNFAVNFEYNGELIFYENCNFDNGVLLKTNNINRNSGNLAETKIYFNPNIISSSEILLNDIKGSGKFTGGKSGDYPELIFNQNKTYCIRIINQVTSDNIVDWFLNWYEEEETYD